MPPTLLGQSGNVTDVEPKPPAQAVADSDPWCTYAQIEVAGLRIAIAAEFVRQAVPRPDKVARLPRSHGALEGVFKLRGQVVPIVDLRPWMGLTADSHPPHVMVLGTHDRVVGVATDAIHGLLRLRASRVQAVHRDDSDEGFFHSVLSETEDSELISVLDPLRLMNQTRAWADGGVGDSSIGPTAGRAATDHGELSAVGQTPMQALVRLGSAVMGVETIVVREVLPSPKLQRVFGRGTALLGMVRWRGVDIPVIDPAKVLDLTLNTETLGSRLLMVLEHEGRHMALPVDSVMAVRSFPVAKVQTAAETGLAPPGCFMGSTSLEDGQRVLLLDSDSLLATYGLVPLSDRGVASTDPVGTMLALTTTASASVSGQAHIVFDMGDEWAIPMNVLHEITPFSSHFKPGAGIDPAITGTFEWRGKAVPVMDLRRPLSAGNEDEAKVTPLKLMVVETNGYLAALVVNDVVALLSAHQGMHTRMTITGGENMHLITVGHPPDRKSYRVMDIGNLLFFQLAG